MDGGQNYLIKYGSANFLNDIKTVGPGSPTYAAPEAGLPHHDQQFSKDEHIQLRCFASRIVPLRAPESRPECQEEQIQHIQWPAIEAAPVGGLLGIPA